MADGSVATYVHRSTGSASEIRRATSTTGDSSIASFATVLTAQALGLGNNAESPGLALNVAGIACASCLTQTSTTTATTTTATTAPAASGSGASNSKTTISCAKGKTVKKVTGTNPKCPAGYKKK